MSVADLIDRDLDKLDPTFRERVEELLRRLKADKHDPMVWEGRRSFARADELQRRGTGVAKSVHCYGLAVDIIDRFHRWNARPAFWADLGRHANALGLTWGGDFRSRVDRPHVQALPARENDFVRRASVAELARRVFEHLDASAPDKRDTVRESVHPRTPVVSPLPAVDAPHKSDKDPR